MFSFFSKLFGLGGPKTDLAALIANGAFLVDVRSPSEFAGGSVKGAVNIPLDKVASNLSKFKDKEQIIVFCQSGMRSAQAKSILNKNGFENVTNGGGWSSVNAFVK
jgi:rhodanese-related sulfurtransferase